VARLASLAVALAVLAVYLFQAPPVSGDKDSAEFTLVLALNGVAHPTGYPIYTLLGHLFVRFVHGLGATWSYAANAWSALGGAAAMFFLHRLGLALIPPAAPAGRGARFLLALLPVAFMAFDPIWTYETTLAEVYSWHVAWVLGTGVCFVSLARSLADGSAGPARGLHGRAAAWGLLCGLGGAHHATALFVAAPLSLALLVATAARRRLRPTLVLTVIVAALVPLASYGVVYWRASHPAPFQWPLLSPGMRGLLDHATGRQYHGNLGHFRPSREQEWLLAWYVWPLLFPGMALLALNAGRARGLDQRTVAWGLGIAALAGTAYAFQYGVPDPSSYFLYPMALGLAALPPLGAWLWSHGARARRFARAGASLLGLAALVLWVPWLGTNSRRVRLYVDFDRYVHSMWESIPFDTAYVFWRNDMYDKLTEYQLLGGERSGSFVYHPLNILNAVPRARFIRRHGFDPGAGLVLEERFPISPAGMESLNDQAAAQVEGRVNRMSPLPVIHFDAEKRTVRLLLKPAARPVGPDSLGR
jgi:hypothetical protein